MVKKKRSKSNIIISWILMLLWMLFIFYMSQQNGTESTQKSDFVANLLRYIGIDGNENVRGIITFIIRKAAHFTEYFILFVLIYRVVTIYFNINNLKYYISIFILFLYACSDEIHQSFIPGRECAVRDVIIDTSGGIIALLFILIINKIRKK